MEKENKDLRKLIEYLQQENKSKSALEALTKKSSKDNNSQLEHIAELLGRIEKAITGIKVDFDLAPVTGVLEQHTALLKSISEEQVLLRKIGEGSLEYDKKMGSYRNTSGREIANKVSGKTVKKGGIIDFETARDPLAGQSKAVIERVTNNNTATTNNTVESSTQTAAPIPSLTPIPEKYVPGENSELDKSIKVLIETLKVTPKKLGEELGKRLSSYKVPEEQKTVSEKLKEVVSIYKRMGAAVLKGPKALASGISDIVRTGKSAFTDPKAFKEKLTSTKETLKEKSKEAFSKVSDIARAETDYTVERERFAKEYAKQNLEKSSETRSEAELIKEGKEKYNTVTTKEGELAAAQKSAKEVTEQGFTPVKSDIEKIVQLKDELRDLKSTLVSKEKETTNRDSTTTTTNSTTTNTNNTNTNTVSNTNATSTTDTNTNTTGTETTSSSLTKLEKEVTDKSTAVIKETEKTAEVFNKEIESLTTNIETLKEAVSKVDNALEVNESEKSSTQAVEPVQAKSVEPVQAVEPKVVSIPGPAAANDSTIETKEKSTEQKFQQIIKQLLVQQKKDASTPVNDESDNVRSSQEIIADNSKEDLEISKKALDITKQQLDELKQIREALAPKIPKELEAAAKTKEVPAREEEDGGGINFGLDLGLGRKALKSLGRGAKALGRGALNLGGKLARFAGSTAGKIGGSALAIGAGAYTAYKGYTGAEEEKQQQLQAIDEKVKSGELTPDKAEEAKKEVEAKTTENKGGAIGEGTGMAAGAIGGGIAGAKVGATIGTFFGGPLGTVVGAGIGTLAGGAIGAISGSSVGKNIGGLVGKGVASVKNFFGGSEDKSKRISSGTITSESSIDEETFSKNDSENYKKFVEFREQRVKELTSELLKKNKVSELSEEDKKTVTQQAQIEAIRQFSKEIETAKASKTNMSTASSSSQTAYNTKNVTSLESVTGKTNITNVTSQSSASENIKATESIVGKTQELSSRPAPLNIPPSPTNQLSVARAPSVGLAINKESTENADLNRSVTTAAPAMPPIISNNVSNNNSTSYVPIKPSVRPESMGSALDRYHSRVSSY